MPDKFPLWCVASQDFEAALADGASAVKFSKAWVKGHIRVGTASMGLGRYTDARESFETALALDEHNEQIKAVRVFIKSRYFTV